MISLVIQVAVMKRQKKKLRVDLAIGNEGNKNKNNTCYELEVFHSYLWKRNVGAESDRKIKETDVWLQKKFKCSKMQRLPETPKYKYGISF